MYTSRNAGITDTVVLLSYTSDVSELAAPSRTAKIDEVANLKVLFPFQPPFVQRY